MRTNNLMFDKETMLKNLVGQHLNLGYDGKTYFNLKTNEIYGAFTPVHISLSEEIEYNGDWIDSVLFFGDGTIKFHLMNEQEAYCWEKFPVGIIDQVNLGLAQDLHYDGVNFNTK